MVRVTLNQIKGTDMKKQASLDTVKKEMRVVELDKAAQERLVGGMDFLSGVKPVDQTDVKAYLFTRDIYE